MCSSGYPGPCTYTSSCAHYGADYGSGGHATPGSYPAAGRHAATSGYGGPRSRETRLPGHLLAAAPR